MNRFALLILFCCSLLITYGCAVNKNKKQTPPKSVVIEHGDDADLAGYGQGARAIISRTYTIRTEGSAAGEKVHVSQQAELAEPKTTMEAAAKVEPSAFEQETDFSIAVDDGYSDQPAPQVADVDGESSVESDMDVANAVDELLTEVAKTKVAEPVVAGGDTTEEQASGSTDNKEKIPFPASKEEVDAAFAKKVDESSKSPTYTVSKDGEVAVSEVAADSKVASASDSISEEANSRAMLGSGLGVDKTSQVDDGRMPFWAIALIVMLLGIALFGILWVILNYEPEPRKRGAYPRRK